MQIFLILLAFVWLVFALVQDLTKREVANWVNFSLIIIALIFRVFYSIFSKNIWIILCGLIGLGIFFIFAHLFYYTRIFAGGDAKLLIALGPILPLNSNYVISNFKILFMFIVFLLVIGSVYGIIYSFVLALKNKKRFSKEFVKQFKKDRNLFFISIIFALFSVFVVIYSRFIFLLAFPIMFLVFPFLYVYGKAVEQVCMMKLVPVSKLTVGDWTQTKIKIGKKIIKPNWQGLSSEELMIIQKYYKRNKKFKNKKVLVKQGIPFVPVFLIAFILVVLWYYGVLGFTLIGY